MSGGRDPRRILGTFARSALRRLVARGARAFPVRLRLPRRSIARREPVDEPAAARRRLPGGRAAPAAKLPQVRRAGRGAGGLDLALARACEAPRALDAPARLDVLAVRRAAFRDGAAGG